MLITITEIDLNSSRLMGNMAIPGYRIRFTSSIATGIAIFVPADIASTELCEELLGVEVNQERIEEFAILPDGSSCIPRFTNIQPDGDYEVVGVVKRIDVRGDDARKGIFSIAAGDAWFTVDSIEIGRNFPEEGNWVKFIAREVSLWDDAI